jgi:propanol-preferring alcohol dehydrogenase
MRAAVVHAFGEPLRIEEVPAPVPAADEVLVRVEACGVCHSDVAIIDGELAGFRALAKPMLVPGHEVVGTVIARGAEVSSPAVGQRVGVAWLHAACGACEQCREGVENLCRKRVVTGLMVDGGYAELMCAKASHALPVPGGLGPVEAAPLFCAGVTTYRAIHNAGLRPGQRVAVLGVGGLGHLAVQIALALGAEVVALDVAEDKLQLARSLGAARALDAGDRGAVKAVQAMGGAHLAVVTSAARAAYDVALSCLRPGGTLSVVGLPAEPLSFAALALVGKEVRILGSAVGTREDLRATLDLAAAGRLRCHVQARPLGQVNEVLEEMRRGRVRGRMVLTF